jgi:energy-coupling factor transporter ATP-binding protein EcfA2
MSHTLIVGVTQSGKTTLARHIARQLAKRKQNIIVLDPVGTLTAGGGWPESAVIFSEESEFWKYIDRDDVGHAHVFIDESGDVLNLSRPENHWILRKGRHYGLFVYMIAQRPTMIAPNCRTQAGICYMFRLATSDAKEICADMGHNWPPENFDEKSEFVALDTGDFYTLHSGSVKVERANVFTLINARKERTK